MSSKKECLKEQLQKAIEIHKLPYQIASEYSLQRPPPCVILNLQQKMFTQILPLYSKHIRTLLRDMISNKNFEEKWVDMCKELERCTLEIDPIEANALKVIIDDKVLHTPIEGITTQKWKENVWNQCQKRITIELPLHKKIPTLSLI